MGRLFVYIAKAPQALDMFFTNRTILGRHACDKHGHDCG
jgi:hypothetical protein